jgi:hypothetical protein
MNKDNHNRRPLRARLFWFMVAWILTGVLVGLAALAAQESRFAINAQQTAQAMASAAHAMALTAQAAVLTAQSNLMTRTSAAPVTEAPTLTGIPAYFYEANVEGFGNYTIEDLYPGAMNFEYPVYLLPNSSEIVTLTITPDLDVGTDLPERFQRIPVPSDIPLDIGEYHHHSSNILFAPEMRVTLTSEGISVVDLDAPKKFMDLGTETLWLWSIRTPPDFGTHPLLLRLYFGDNESPIWSFSFTLSVTYPTETALPTVTRSPTPLPTLTPTLVPTLTPLPTETSTKTVGQRLGDVWIEKSPDVFGNFLDLSGVLTTALVGLVGVIVGALIQRATSQKSKEIDEGLSEKPSTDRPPNPPKGRSSKGRNKVNPK